MVERELIAGWLKPFCSGRRHFYARRLNVVGAMGEGRISERSEGENYQRPFPIDSAKVKPATIGSVEPASYLMFDSRQVLKKNDVHKGPSICFHQ